jgi:RNA polymerase sigma-70 factor (ECF subfamily)
MEAAMHLGPLDFAAWNNLKGFASLGVPVADNPTHAATETGLIRAARGGDRAAFGKLVDLHKRAVFGLALRLVGPSDAADASQEAFLRAFQRLSTFDPSQPLRPWLLGIARNACIDMLRRRGRQPEPIEMDVATHIAGDDPSPDDAIDTRSQSRRVEAALGSLPQNQREALLLFHQEQLSYRDIAGVLGVPIGTVMTWIHRARRALRDQLEANA